MKMATHYIVFIYYFVWIYITGDIGCFQISCTGLQLQQYVGRTFLFSDFRTEQFAAEAYCVDRGGHLTPIFHTQHQNFLVDKMIQFNARNFHYIGLYSEEPCTSAGQCRQQMRWLDRSSGDRYLDWSSSSEPNEQCVVLRPDGDGIKGLGCRTDSYGDLYFICHFQGDPCENYECNNGACVRNSSTLILSCNCAAGYQGERCTETVCISAPCQHGGSCEVTNNGYMCHCQDGFSGANCEVDIQPCSSIHCQNEGSCENTGDGGYSCHCVDGFSGANCEDTGASTTENERGNGQNTDLNSCLSTHCQNRGSCELTNNGYMCHCEDGYSGAQCEEITSNNKSVAKNKDSQNWYVWVVAVFILLALTAIISTIIYCKRNKSVEGRRVNERGLDTNQTAQVASVTPAKHSLSPTVCTSEVYASLQEQNQTLDEENRYQRLNPNDYLEIM